MLTDLASPGPAKAPPDSQNWRRCFPLLQIAEVRSPKWNSIPPLEEFQQVSRDERVLKSYHIRVERPKFPWLLFAFAFIYFNLYIVARAIPPLAEFLRETDSWLLITWHLRLFGLIVGVLPGSLMEALPRDFWFYMVRGFSLLLPTGLVLLYHLSRERGHTILYLTNQRVVVLELARGLLKRRQTILNYSLRNVAGFTVYAQRGLKKFLSLFLLKEKRTFYLNVVTRTTDSLQLGAINSRGSRFDPGRDAVSLCSELDSLVLALRLGRP